MPDYRENSNYESPHQQNNPDRWTRNSYNNDNFQGRRGRGRGRGQRRGGYNNRSGGRGYQRGGGRGGGWGGNQGNDSFGNLGDNLNPIDWATVELSPFKKSFLKIQEQALTEEEVKAWRTKHKMEVEGNSPPDPIRTFEECGFPDMILFKLYSFKFTAPTPIQSQGWPMALTGRDVVGIAQTGSGKTLAFVLPAIVHIEGQSPLRQGDGPIALVVSPTRELACQIETEAKKFITNNIGISCVYGGVPKHKQQWALRKGVEMVICTPGRMLDFIERKVTNFRRTSYVVFDEADRMLDMGFEPQIRLLMSQIRPDRQVLMWSATWPDEVQNLANDFLPNDKLTIKCGGEDGDAVCENVSQIVHVIKRCNKREILIKTLGEYQDKKIVIFTATKRMANDLENQLRRQGYTAEAIHGDKKQWDRDKALRNFKSGYNKILVATDVASRGIHVDDIALVLNYDFPGNCEDYIHRIGRTGRAGKKGVAVSFFEPDVDKNKAFPLIKILERSNQPIPEELYIYRHLGYARKRNSRSSGGKKSDKFKPYKPAQLDFAQLMKDNANLDF